MEQMLKDSFGRHIDYLRLSVTDRCNFKCVYCHPMKGLKMLDKESVLSFEEMERLVRILVPLGVQKVRLTGGEPLLRKGIPKLIGSLKTIHGIKKIALTTNGALLGPVAKELKQSGLDQVTISLDTLNAKRFEKLTLSSCFKNVFSGMLAAVEAGLLVKVNVVVLIGTSFKEIFEMVKLAIRLKFEVRFLEFMPLCGESWAPDLVLPIPTIRAWVQEHFKLDPILRKNQVAESYQIRGTEGRVGFIASLSEPFCDNCSRLRISANGKIRPCLFSSSEIDLLKKLRSHSSDEEIRAILKQAVWNKQAGHSYRPKKDDLSKIDQVSKEPIIRSIGG